MTTEAHKTDTWQPRCEIYIFGYQLNLYNSYRKAVIKTPQKMMKKHSWNKLYRKADLLSEELMYISYILDSK
jgi:hypothetical protein